MGAPGAPEVKRVAGGGAPTSVVKLKAGIEKYRISPDGKKVAFNDTPRGWLYVAAADGSGKRKIDTAPTFDVDWSPDSRQLVYSAYTTTMGTVARVANADGSGQRTLGQNAFFPVWSPDGGWIAYATHAATSGALDRITVVRIDGSQRRTVKVAFANAGQRVWGVQSLSTGGREVFVAVECSQCSNFLPMRDFIGSTVVDTNTGATRTIPATGGTVEMMIWLADGRTVVRIVTVPATPIGDWARYDVELRGADGSVIARAPEHDGLHGQLTTYVA